MELYKDLINIISTYKSAVIAFSGGVDSTFLAKVAKDVLNDKVLLVTATSSTYPAYEFEDAEKMAKELGLKHRAVHSEEMYIPEFSANPPNRCYYCKREFFTVLNRIKYEEGCDVVFDGSNVDDLSDMKPGLIAIKELGIVSPLCEAGLTKADIRKLSEYYGLATASKPSFACLASRFPYGEKITKQKLVRVGDVEKSIRDLGFTQFRVRSHENLARLEFIASEFEEAWQARRFLQVICKQAGYIYITIDLEGYRTGSMNEVLFT